MLWVTGTTKKMVAVKFEPEKAFFGKHYCRFYKLLAYLRQK